MARRLSERVFAIAVAMLCLPSMTFAQGLLDPPIPLNEPHQSSPAIEPAIRRNIDPIRKDDLQPVVYRDDVKPARVGGVRSPSGESAVPANRDLEAEEYFLKSSKISQRKLTDDDDKSILEEPRPERLRNKNRERDSNRFTDLFGGNGLMFKGDDCFQGMISPVTNPHLFEDPRSLTEIRPTFYYQKIPSNQPNFQGGNIWYFGTSARLAINERWSVTLNKLGALSFDPGNGGNEFGFGEVHLGPKWSFYRNTESETVAAAGLLFQLPFGNAKIFQDTGSLSLVPYLTVGQQLIDTQAGTLNGLLAGGYSFSVNGNRSDYFYVSGNVNFDWANRHRFYPLVEMNWYTYTTNGNERPALPFEGRDFANLGGQGKGSNLLTAAFGARFKINERAQIGGAYEIPFMGNRDLFRYRFTMDVIIRF